MLQKFPDFLSSLYRFEVLPLQSLKLSDYSEIRKQKPWQCRSSAVKIQVSGQFRSGKNLSNHVQVETGSGSGITTVSLLLLTFSAITSGTVSKSLQIAETSRRVLVCRFLADFFLAVCTLLFYLHFLNTGFSWFILHSFF